ncbi:MAG: replicative DNA helicase [Deltaproteobacteria bacterium]|nr:replicative DNA helicase [Deltaproteobacteria bacterium]
MSDTPETAPQALVPSPPEPPADVDRQVRRLRTPPHSLDAERSVLGGILIDNQAIDHAQEHLEPQDFYREAHRQVFESMLSLQERGEPVDELTVSDELRRGGNLDRVGGLTALSELAQSTPTSAHVRAYARIVHEKAVLRRMIAAATGIVEQGMRQEVDVREYVDLAEKAIFEVSEDRKRHGYEPIKEVLKGAFQKLEAAANRGEAITGVPTGFVQLDHMLAGLQPSDLVIVAGRPSMGKTAFTLNVAAGASIRPAADKRMPTVVFSLEMSSEQLAMRLLGAEARVDLSKLRNGRLAPPDWATLSHAAGRISEAPLFIDDSGVLNVFDVRTKCRRLKREHGLGLVIIDYLQLMSGVGKVESRAQEISDISRGLKAIARELEVPVVALSQLNRSLESRTDKRPMMSDLRESGAIEQDADVIMFLYRDEYYNKDSPKKGTAEIIVAKQRNGPTGMVELAFLPHLTRFENLAPEG